MLFSYFFYGITLQNKHNILMKTFVIVSVRFLFRDISLSFYLFCGTSITLTYIIVGCDYNRFSNEIDSDSSSGC